ncbi:MAG: hypothetical protein GF418_13395 [Chitinivibrionales bacterium]|nr:hypothetical protein [Chitinivibrionales bacterium]MBD3396614.1 hypothetical protein [Chitinivibrionales bacterium]
MCYIAKARLTFEAGKIYYLIQAVYPVPMVGITTSLTLMPCEEAAAKLEQEKGNFTYTRINPARGIENLDADDVEEEREDRKEWADENPDKAKAEIEYKGC